MSTDISLINKYTNEIYKCLQVGKYFICLVYILFKYSLLNNSSMTDE